MKRWPNSAGRPDVALLLSGSSRLAYVGSDGLVIVDGATGAEEIIPAVFADTITAAALSDDGETLFLGSSPDSDSFSEGHVPVLARIAVRPDGLGQAETLLSYNDAEEQDLRVSRI